MKYQSLGIKQRILKNANINMVANMNEKSLFKHKINLKICISGEILKCIKIYLGIKLALML